jgi:hypothetical protein
LVEISSAGMVEEPDKERSMDAEGYADLVPWLVFVVIERKTGLGIGWAGGCASVSAAALVAAAYWRGRRAPVAKLGVVLFAILCAADFVVPPMSSQIADARIIAVLALAAAAFGSLRFSPISAAYTAAEVAPAVREDPRFRRVNAEISTAWGVGAVLVAVAYLVSHLFHDAVGYTFLNWVVPLAVATAVLIWSARRWQMFRLEAEGDWLAEGTGERGPMTRELGSWVEAHDAVVHRLPSTGRPNA